MDKIKEFYLSEGNALFDKGDYVLAIASYSKAIDCDLDDFRGFYNRSMAYIVLNMYDLAQIDRHMAIQLNPQVSGTWKDESKLASDAYVSMGNESIILGDYDEASKSFDEAIKLFPEQIGAHIGRGVVFYEQDQFHQAIAAHSEALRLEPGNLDALYNRAISYMQLKDFDSAYVDFSRFVAFNCTDEHVINMLEECDCERKSSGISKDEKPPSTS